MNSNSYTCCLTGSPITKWRESSNPEFVEYEAKSVGKVLMSVSAFTSSFERAKELAGCCRECFEKGLPAIPIFELNVDGVFNSFKKQGIEPPQNFKEKRIKILEHLIRKGGEEFRETDIDPNTDCTLIYGDEPELRRVMKSLMTENLIIVKALNKDDYGRVLPTPEGIRFVKEPPTESINLSLIFSHEEKTRLFTLIGEGKLSEATDLITSILLERGKLREYSSVLRLRGNYKSAQKSLNNGAIEHKELRLEGNRLTESILKMLMPVE